MTSKRDNSGRGSAVSSGAYKPTGTAPLATGVTGDNFADKAKQFMAENGYKGAIIVQRTCAVPHEGRMEADLKPWGAWVAYRKKHGLPVKWMETRDYYTVPALWPHMFDAQATIADDTRAADDFVLHMQKKIAKEFDMKNRLDRVTEGAAVKNWRANRMQRTPKAHLEPPAEAEPDYRDPSELEASRARLGLDPPKERIDL